MNIYIYLPAHPAHGSQFLKAPIPDDPQTIRTTYFAGRKALCTPDTAEGEDQPETHAAAHASLHGAAAGMKLISAAGLIIRTGVLKSEALLWAMCFLFFSAE